jgi:hypothetical protein
MGIPTAIQIPGASALSSVRQLAPLAQVGSIYLFQGESEILHAAMEEFVSRLAMRNPVQVIVGGNRISFEHLSLILGEQIGQVYQIMDRILVSRAETCYQMKDVLTALEPIPSPIVITDMLASFYDENLTLPEVTLLLQKCIQRVHQLSELAPVLISADPDPARLELLQLVDQNSDQRFYFEPFENVETVLQSAFPGF